MLRALSQSAFAAMARRGTAALCTLVLTSVTVLGQGSTTATIRGNIQDPSGGVLPGATITVTNTGTKAVQTVVSDDRGQYQFGALFPGTYDLRVELSGFKSYERKALALSPSDNRGIDVRLDVGQQSETITVTAQQEVIQTQTGAREGVLSAKQIDNLSVIGRSALELLRILPGVVTDFNQGESVSFGGGANNTQGYTVNGIRSSGNTVSLDGSSLIDIGSNSGVIVTLNNDMVQEVKVQSSNFAAEYGAGGMNVSGVTKAGTSAFHGQGYYYSRDSKFAANDRSNSIAGTPKPKSKYQYPGGNIGGPISFGDSYTKNRDKLFFFAAFEVQRQQVDSGSRFNRTVYPGDAQRRLQRSVVEPRVEPEQHPAAAHSAGLRQRGPAGAEQRHAAVHDADGQVPREPVSAAELQRSEQSLQLRLQPPRADEPDGLQDAVRLEHQQQHEGVRPRRARR